MSIEDCEKKEDKKDAKLYANGWKGLARILQALLTRVYQLGFYPCFSFVKATPISSFPRAGLPPASNSFLSFQSGQNRR